MSKIKTPGLTESLMATVENHIKNLQVENEYFDQFFNSIGTRDSGVSDINPADSEEKLASLDKSQTGVGIPRWYGMNDTFIANPSNVGVGILSRMIETDDSVSAAVQFKAIMMISKIGEYQHEKPEISDFVNDYLKSMYGPTWSEALESMASKFGYGFSVSEVVQSINKNNRKVPAKIKTYHPSTICFEVDPWGEITEWGIIQFIIQNAQISNPNQYFPYFQYGFKVNNPFETPDDRLLPYRMAFINNYGLTRIWKHKCIHHIENDLMSFGSPYGKSPVRTAHLAWQMKVYFMRQLGIAGKRQASPFIWATAPHNVNQVQVKDPRHPNGQVTKTFNAIEALSEVLRNRSTDDSVVTGPEDMGYKIEAIAAQTDLRQFTDVIAFLNTLIFRSFLLPSLVMTEGQAGSRSLGDKHFEIVDRIAETDAEKFGMRVIDQMIRRSIVENFGEQDDYGHFARRPQSIDERERLANMFMSLGNAGWMRSTDAKDGDYVRSVLHLPEQEESFYEIPSPNLPPLDGDEDMPPQEKLKPESEDEKENSLAMLGQRDDLIKEIKELEKKLGAHLYSDDFLKSMNLENLKWVVDTLKREIKKQNLSLYNLAGLRKVIPYEGHHISIWDQGATEKPYTWKVERGSQIIGRSKNSYQELDEAVDSAKQYIDQRH